MDYLLKNCWDTRYITVQNKQSYLIFSYKYWYGLKGLLYTVKKNEGSPGKNAEMKLSFLNQDGKVAINSFLGSNIKSLKTNYDFKSVHTISTVHKIEENGKHSIYTYMNGMLLKEEKDITVTDKFAPEITIGAMEYTETQTSSVTVNDYNDYELQYQYTKVLNNPVYSVRIYDKALSSTEIATNYATDKTRFGSGT